MYRISRQNGRVTLRLTDAQTDMQVYFISKRNENHILITVSEGTGVDIDKDCGSMVAKGTDVHFLFEKHLNGIGAFIAREVYCYRTERMGCAAGCGSDMVCGTN